MPMENGDWGVLFGTVAVCFILSLLTWMFLPPHERGFTFIAVVVTGFWTLVVPILWVGSAVFS